MSPVEPDSSHGKITYGTSSSSGYEVEPNSNGKSKNFQQGRNEESAKSKKKENHYTTNAGNRDNFDNTRQFDNNIKYTIASCGLPSSPPKEEDDEYDNEVASILRNARMRESPRSLLELDRKYLDQKKEELHDHDSYIADGEDNNHTTRRYLPIGDSSSNETKNLVKRPSTGSISSNKNKNAGRKSSFDATTKETLPIKPPPITRKLHIDMFPTFVPNAENEEMYSPTNQINAEYPYEKSAGPTYVRDIVKGSETDSRPPKHAFGSYGSKWNSPTPSLAGLCPSSNDTVGSGYGSLDYSSGTDQSHETLPASNRRVLVAEDRMKKSSIRKGRRMNKPKPCPKSSNRTEQLPLVPEDISTRGEENGLYSEDQYLVRNGRSETQYNNELRSPKKKKQRQIFISHLLDEVRGCKQPASCHDKFFAILFYAQVIIISLLGIRYGPQAFGYNGIGTGVTVEYGVVAFTYKNVIILTLGSGLVAIMISSLLLFLITTAARSVIPLSLFIAMTLALIGSVISIFFSPETYVPIIGLVSFGVCVVFTFIVWDRIPFVTAQLNTALSALKEAYSIIVLACIMQIVALVVIIFYFFTCIGIYDYFQVDQTLWPREWKIACYVGLVISFTWTFEVLSVR